MRGIRMAIAIVAGLVMLSIALSYGLDAGPSIIVSSMAGIVVYLISGGR